LFLIGHGEPVQVAECRLCGYAERWELAEDEASESDSDADDRR
jgi:hypothetical protein